MSFQYSINDLASRAGVSCQSVYNILSKDKEFVKENSTKQQRKIKYNQAVLDRILEYYGKDQAFPDTKDETESAAQEPALLPDKPGTKVVDDSAVLLEAKDREIEELRVEIERLTKALDKSEADRNTFIAQNNQLLLLLQQEKQEKMLLLPAPKKTLGQRIKNRFGHKAVDSDT